MRTITKKGADSARETLRLYKEQILKEYNAILNSDNPLYDENTLIENCDKISIRLYNILRKMIKPYNKNYLYGQWDCSEITLKDLGNISISEFMKTRNAGQKTLKELISILSDIGIVMKQ